MKGGGGRGVWAAAAVDVPAATSFSDKSSVGYKPERGAAYVAGIKSLTSCATQYRPRLRSAQG